MTSVTVRYWAAARAASGVASESARPGTLAALRAELLERHGQEQRFATVLGGCAVLVDEVPVTSRNPDDVTITAGQVVEFLPPYAGG